MTDLKRLEFKDFSALAAWMAVEIADYYCMNKKDLKNQPPHVHQVLYRVPISLAHEERVILAIFIKEIFWIYCETGKINDFDWEKIFSQITRQLGMRDYRGIHLNI